MHDLRGATDDSGGAPGTPIEVAYVGGGSTNWALTFLNDLAQSELLDGHVDLYDVDHESAVRNAELGNRVHERSDVPSDVTYAAVEDLDRALAGADVVVLSTQDPPGETYVHDLGIPEEYGIHQTVADTVGPGGTIRAMRTAPVYRDLAAAIRDNCPEAWVINYTNPMSVCTRTLADEFPDIDVIGLCHGVFATQRLFADLAGEHLDVETPPQEAIDLDVTGINHCTWATAARWNGRDLYPLLADELAANGPASDPTPDSIVAGNRIAFDLYDTYDVLPAISGRHLSEFLPWYLGDEATIEDWELRRNDPEEWLSEWDDRGDRRDAYLEDGEQFPLTDSGEVGVDVVEALAGGPAIKTNANVPNRGQAPSLPEDAAVETNVLVTGGRVTPLVADPLPPDVRTQVERHVTNQETVVAASETGDVDRAFRAFQNDPLVGSLSTQRARSLFTDLIDAQRSYFEAWDLEGSAVLAGQ
jgi:alpha-galactosidase